VRQIAKAPAYMEQLVESQPVGGTPLASRMQEVQTRASLHYAMHYAE
jgi:hypothetical protein